MIERDPAFDFQVAVFAVLTNDVGVISALGGSARVYDRVPQNPTFPFIHIGDDQVLEGVTYQFSGSSTVVVNVHAFSRYSGKTEVKAIAGAVRAALCDYIPVNNFEVVTYHFEDTHYMTESDGLTEHAVITIAYELNASN